MGPIIRTDKVSSAAARGLFYHFAMMLKRLYAVLHLVAFDSVIGELLLILRVGGQATASRVDECVISAGNQMPCRSQQLGHRWKGGYNLCYD